MIAALLRFIYRKRSGADDAHLAFDDVDQLGKLIYACTPDHLSNLRHPGIILNLEGRSIHLVFVEETLMKILRVFDH